ncbi:hypothetical protein IE077_001230 [Cardiosporidium cionae]|uniref:Spindle assembly abnormal protein 6 N-terminal domain-containing protein n=1 Tax=Cardiosporidium cionae TaxID=476202 RepID=A0ABQ7JDD7_9APIC|nr:hypothetical protein IE077_001230 [Cardiosporidium cionae]|eukprot:KAF8822013.1 hypothetical protein IE077_001230 [Cardiosporidium cionae]
MKSKHSGNIREKYPPLCCSLNVHPSEEDMNFISHLDLSSIDKMDPLLENGHAIIYDKEIPFELRYQDSQRGPQEIGTVELCRVKIGLLVDEDMPTDICMEFSCENDLFFNYNYRANEVSFKTMQESQKLMIDFADYPNVLMKMLNSCVKEPQSFLAIFIIQPDTIGKLDFVQNMEYKYIELLSLECLQASGEETRRSIAFRYNVLKSKAALLQARLHDIATVVKIKNPALFLLLQKSAKNQAISHSSKSFCDMQNNVIRYRLKGHSNFNS